MTSAIAHEVPILAAPVWTLRGDALREALALVLEEARSRTLALVADLSDEALRISPPGELAPLTWELGHIAAFEERWLLRALGGPALMPPEIDALYDAEAHAASERGGLPTLDPKSARAYLAHVRKQVLATLSRTSFGKTDDPLLHAAAIFGLVIQHEHRHVEAMLATVQALSPAGLSARDTEPLDVRAPRCAEVYVPGGPFVMGNDDVPWALDRERPAHVVKVPPFFIDAAPVTNAQFQTFIEDGGYHRRELWSDEGWAFVEETGAHAPLYWQRVRGGWSRRRFDTTEPVPPHEPVQHVSFHEAEAYARWAQKRLPTEAEWEKAACVDPQLGKRLHPWGEEPADATRANLAIGRWGPARVGAFPAGATPSGIAQLFGDVWEWTSSDAQPYPGFRPFPDAGVSKAWLGAGRKVLRGGSWATHPLALRYSARAFEPAARREVFTGFRCVRSG